MSLKIAASRTPEPERDDEREALRAMLAKKFAEIFADIDAEPIPERFARLLETPPDPPPFGGGASARSQRSAPVCDDCSGDDVVEGLKQLKTAA
jgi:hypothetical protein